MITIRRQRRATGMCVFESSASRTAQALPLLTLSPSEVPTTKCQQTSTSLAMDMRGLSDIVTVSDTRGLASVSV